MIEWITLLSFSFSFSDVINLDLNCLTFFIGTYQSLVLRINRSIVFSGGTVGCSCSNMRTSIVEAWASVLSRWGCVFLSDSSFLRDDISVELKYLFVAVYAFVILLKIMIISLFRAVIFAYLGQSNALTLLFLLSGRHDIFPKENCKGDSAVESWMNEICSIMLVLSSSFDELETIGAAKELEGGIY